MTSNTRFVPTGAQYPNTLPPGEAVLSQDERTIFYRLLQGAFGHEIASNLVLARARNPIEAHFDPEQVKYLLEGHLIDVNSGEAVLTIDSVIAEGPPSLEKDAIEGRFLYLKLRNLVRVLYSHKRRAELANLDNHRPAPPPPTGRRSAPPPPTTPSARSRTTSTVTWSATETHVRSRGMTVTTRVVTTTTMTPDSPSSDAGQVTPTPAYPRHARRQAMHPNMEGFRFPAADNVENSFAEPDTED